MLLEEQPQKVGRRPLVLECVDSGIQIKDFSGQNFSKLLILGDAGSGKTIALLTLAKNLILQAKQDENAGIPVIFELSEWPGERQSLSGWMVEKLRNRKGFRNIKRKVLKQWLSDGVFILLLDGLDELKDSKQASCVHAINKFVEVNPLVKIAVCCLSQTFEVLEEAGVSISLRSAVHLQRLKEEQIQQYFRDVKREDLWQTICCNNTNKSDLLEVPLFLALLASFPPNQDIVSRSSLLDEYLIYQLSSEARKQHYESYKDRKWSYKPGEEPTSHKTLHYLKWLAKKLSDANLTEFQVEYITQGLPSPQPIDWLDKASSRKAYWVMIFTFLFVCLFLINFWVKSFFVQLLPAIASIVAAMLLSVSLVYILTSSFNWATFQITRRLTIYIKRYFIKTNALMGLRHVIPCGLAMNTFQNIIGCMKHIKPIFSFIILFIPLVLILKVIYTLLSHPKSKLLLSELVNSAPIIASGIFGGILIGCLAGVIGTFAANYEKKRQEHQNLENSSDLDITSVHPHEDLKHPFYPNKNSLEYEIKEFLINLFLITQIGYFLGATCIEFLGIETPAQAVIPLIPGVLVMMISCFSLLMKRLFCFSFVDYLINLPLRLILCFGERVIPWNYVRFLNYCVEYKLLQCIGGRYRFIHRELLDHIAQMEL